MTAGEEEGRYHFVDQESFDAVHVDVHVVSPDPPARNVVSGDEEACEVSVQGEH